MSLSLPQDDTAAASTSQPLSFRALQRLEATREHDGIAERPESIAPTPQQRARPDRPLSRRQQRLDAEARRVWRSQKARVIEALRDLRAEAETGLYQSPDLTRAALFQLPRADEVPAPPVWSPDGGNGRGRKAGKRKRGAPRKPSRFDMSDAAQAFRALDAERTEKLRRRREHSHAARLVPYNTWRNLGAAGERGGKRPGERAYPAAWASYLERFDNEETDGWGSPLGIAFKRVETVYANTKLLRALWLATDPDDVRGIDEIAAALGIRRRMAEYWIDAACKRLWAEMTDVIHGHNARETEREMDAARQAVDAAHEMGEREVSQS